MHFVFSFYMLEFLLQLTKNVYICSVFTIYNQLFSDEGYITRSVFLIGILVYITMQNFYYNSLQYFFLLAITNPKAEPNSKDAQKNFNFDYSYWSHDVSNSCQRNYVKI